MAKTTRVVLVCDLHGDGTEAVTTIRMDNGTARYELDLCQSHFDELTGAGRRLRARRRTGGARSATSAAKKTAAAKTPRHGRGARTQRQCANGPASMAIRSAIAVASRVTSWKPSPPASRPCRTQDRRTRATPRPGVRTEGAGDYPLSRTNHDAPHPYKLRAEPVAFGDIVLCPLSPSRSPNRYAATRRRGGT